ncbi:MAG: SsrA-binding protein SmpB [Candidatus Paceibacterota bacterium]
MAPLAQNKKIFFNFELLETLSAGIELFGHEVKAVRGGKMTLEGSHVTIRGNEAFLVNSSIMPYQPANTPKEYEPARNRKLLLTKKELQKLASIEQQKGLTIVPISVYNKGKKVKVDIAVVRGKKKFDKRETLKKREDKRHIERTLKNEY